MQAITLVSCDTSENEREREKNRGESEICRFSRRIQARENGVVLPFILLLLLFFFSSLHSSIRAVKKTFYHRVSPSLIIRFAEKKTKQKLTAEPTKEKNIVK